MKPSRMRSESIASESTRCLWIRKHRLLRLPRMWTGNSTIPRIRSFGWPISDKRKQPMHAARGTAGNPGRNVHAKAGLNREILRSGWGLLVRRLEDKAPGRVEKVNPAFTGQRCSVCRHVDARSRQSQARFVCTACGFAGNADVNAARNIAAGHAVTARGGDGVARPVNREPHLLLQSA